MEFQSSASRCRRYHTGYGGFSETQGIILNDHLPALCYISPLHASHQSCVFGLPELAEDSKHVCGNLCAWGAHSRRFTRGCVHVTQACVSECQCWSGNEPVQYKAAVPLLAPARFVPIHSMILGFPASRTLGNMFLLFIKPPRLWYSLL